MKFSTPRARSILVCPQCRGLERATRLSCTVCRGMVAGVYERGRWLYFGETYGRTKIAVTHAYRSVQRALYYAALGVMVLSLGVAVALFITLVLDPHAVDYTIRELMLVDHRIRLFFYLGMIAACFAVYQHVRRTSSSAGVESFDYRTDIPDQADTALDWGRIVLLPRAKRQKLSSALSGEAWAGINAGYRKASDVGDDVFFVHHLLWGLLTTPTARSMCLRLGFSAAQLQKALFPQEYGAHKTCTEPVYADSVWRTLFEAYDKAYYAREPQVGVPELVISLVEHSPEIQEWLFGLGIEADMLTNVVAWMRTQQKLARFYQVLSHAAWLRPHTGMDKAMTAVATPLLNQCSEDVTVLAQFGHTDPCVAREREFDELLRIIGTTNRPVLIIADHGIGKKTLVNGLAQRMVQNDVPPRLRDKRLVRLSIPALVAGTTAAGAVERLMVVMHEVARSGNIIICIDNIHELMGISAGGGQSLDVGGALANALSSGRFTVIGTCTPEAYSQVIATTTLGSLFVPLKLTEMDDNQAIQALESKVGLLEHQHNVFYSYGAISKAVELSKRFLRETYLPGSALQLLTEAGALAHVQGGAGIVSAETVATVLAQKTHIPVTTVGRDESTRLLELEKILHQRVIGQDEAVSLVANALRRARAEIRAKNRPIANFLFLGPTGVGKTELTKTIAQVYFGGEERMIRLDMSEYQDKGGIYRLIGAPGQKGSGFLTEAVRRSPFALILLDELEKADKDVLNIFLQVMDDGRLSDSTGRVVDFTNTVIIATSNAGTAYVSDRLKEGLSTDVIKDRLIHGELRTYFRPEFLNRFDGIVLFKPLEREHIRRIARLMLQRITTDLEEKGIVFEITDEGLDFIAQVGFDPEFGARPLRRAIEEHVENRLAEFVLSGRVGRRSTVILGKDGELHVTVS